MLLTPRSMLFVSGERADRFDKAMATGADLVCIDLEDAVAAARKADARQAALAYALERRRISTAGPALAIRINGLSTLEGLRDIQALAGSGADIDVLLLPKVESPQELQWVHRWLPTEFRALVVLIETPLGIEQAHTIGSAVRDGAPRLTALMLGGADLSMELGARFEWDSLAGARARLVNAAKACALQAWDVPFIHVADTQGLQDETRRAIAMGFDCKSAIHPTQVAPIHEAVAPRPDEITWAQGVIDGLDAHQRRTGGAGAFLHEGKMVDAPLIRRAQQVLQRAD